MINLKVRTEYSFKTAYGKLNDVLDHFKESKSLAITDRSSTFGHIKFYKNCIERNIKPIYGVEIAVVDDASLRGKERHGCNYMTFIAKNNEGLKIVYRLLTLATEQFHNFARIDYDDIARLCTDDIFILSGYYPDLERLIAIENVYVELSPATRRDVYEEARELGFPFVATNDNYFLKIDDRPEYEAAIGRDSNRSTLPMHVLTERELRRWWNIDEAYENTYKIAEACNVEIRKAQMVKPDRSVSLIDQCKQNGRIDFSDPIYMERLKFEIDIIESKNFTDYFYVIADLVNYAKRHMMVGPARGSSCGSLLCYGLGITDIDPLQFDLLFERFIDINRNDYPDIDIDFQDNKRDMIFAYLSEKYGKDNFAQIGTLSKRTSQTCINETAKTFGVDQYDLDDFKDQIIDRSPGDKRFDKCIEDSWESDVGQKTLEKYPFLNIANNIEGHCSHTGKHAAGVVITDSPVGDYCAINRRDGECTIMLDKDDAEFLNILKIDILGLRTLTIIQDCLDLAGIEREWLSSQSINRQEVFDVFNDRLFIGIFQFEGKALQKICKQMKISSIEDISSITSLARPGPMESGGDQSFVDAKNGEVNPFYFHEIHKKITEKTYGVIVYQEQVMHLARQLGKMDWKDVNALRKAIGKSKGQEAIQSFKAKFEHGCKENGLDEQSIQLLWDQIVTMGGYAFNRSHAIAYSLVSYWTALLKNDFPKEFAIASLQHATDDKRVKILREYKKNIGDFIAFDIEKSDVRDWTVVDDILVGPLTGAKGVGINKAKDIKRLLKSGEEFTPGLKKLVNPPNVPYADIFPCERLWGDMYREPEKFNIVSSSPSYMCDIDSVGEYVCIGRVVEFDIRNSNSKKNIEKRNGKVKDGPEHYMIMTIEDDTEELKCYVDNKVTQKYKKDLANVGAWLIFKGRINDGFDLFSIERVRKLC